MRQASILLSVVALLGLSGCPSECPDCGIPCAPPSPPLVIDHPGLVLVGQEARLGFLESLTRSPCGDEPSGQPTSATSEVSGSDGELIPSEVTFDGPGSPPSPVLRFTPPRPGPYHALVLFSPVGGLHQFDVHAALDRSAEAPSHMLSRPCFSLERTLQGAWVCDSAVLRGDTVVQQFPDARLAASGDVVWVASSSQLSRLVDTGSALTQTGSVSYPSRPIEFLLASPDELLVLHDSLLARYTTGTVLSRSTAPVNMGSLGVGPQAPRGILLREGDWLGVVTLSGGSQDAVLQVCPYQLAAEGPVRTQEACQQLPGLVIGFEPSVLWTMDPGGLDVESPGFLIHRWVWAGGRLTEEGSLRMGAPMHLVGTSLARPTAVPVVRSQPTLSLPTPLTAVVGWSPGRRSFILEHLDAEVLAPLASPSFHWGRLPPSTLNGTLRIRTRPAAPP